MNNQEKHTPRKSARIAEGLNTVEIEPPSFNILTQPPVKINTTPSKKNQTTSTKKNPTPIKTINKKNTMPTKKKIGVKT